MVLNNNKRKILVLVISFLAVEVNSQSLSLLNAVVSWTNIGPRTVFNATLSGVSGTSSWLGVGINTSPAMVFNF
jgi:hypothetical protein